MIGNVLKLIVVSDRETVVLRPVVFGGEARIWDLELGKRLGFERPLDIRKLIRRYEADLAGLGGLATVANHLSALGGRPGTGFFLNENQALFVAAKSGTLGAKDTIIEIIECFPARKRRAAPAPAPAMSEDELMARAWLVANKRIEAMQAAVADARLTSSS